MNINNNSSSSKPPLSFLSSNFRLFFSDTHRDRGRETYCCNFNSRGLFVFFLLSPLKSNCLVGGLTAWLPGGRLNLSLEKRKKCEWFLNASFFRVCLCVKKKSNECVCVPPVYYIRPRGRNNIEHTQHNTTNNCQSRILFKRLGVISWLEEDQGRWQIRTSLHVVPDNSVLTLKSSPPLPTLLLSPQ